MPGPGARSFNFEGFKLSSMSVMIDDHLNFRASANVGLERILIQG
jgi:hypothetical protein